MRQCRGVSALLFALVLKLQIVKEVIMYATQLLSMLETFSQQTDRILVEPLACDVGASATTDENGITHATVFLRIGGILKDGITINMLNGPVTQSIGNT